MTLACWLIFYIAGYSLLGLPDFPWYYGPPAIVLALFLWMGLHAAAVHGAHAIRLPGELVAHCLTWMAAIFTLLTVLANSPLRLSTPHVQEYVQVQAGRWLREHAQPEDTVVAYESGAVAYLSGLRTTDLLGLTEPRARPHLRRADLAWAIRDLPTFVFATERGMWPVTDAIFTLREFALNYRPAVRLPFREYSDYVLYRRADQEQPHRIGGPVEAEWVDLYHPSSMRRGLVAAYSLTVRNLSTSSWQPSASTAPLITYRWHDEQGHRVTLEQMHTPLPCDVAPGQRILVSAKVRAPDDAGKYVLRWDLLRRGASFLEREAMASAPATVLVY
jgi:hypothetical protein